MTELFLLVLALSVLGFVYGFYGIVHEWMKPRVERLVPKIKSLILKIKKLIPKPKPKPKSTKYKPRNPYSFNPRHEALRSKAKEIINQYRSPLSVQVMSRPWSSVPPSERTRVFERAQMEMDLMGVQSAVAKQVQQELRKVESDLFWSQIEQECQKLTGSRDFKRMPEDLGQWREVKKSKKKGYLK